MPWAGGCRSTPTGNSEDDTHSQLDADVAVYAAPGGTVLIAIVMQSANKLLLLSIPGGDSVLDWSKVQYAELSPTGQLPILLGWGRCGCRVRGDAGQPRSATARVASAITLLRLFDGLLLLAPALVVSPGLLCGSVYGCRADHAVPLRELAASRTHPGLFLPVSRTSQM